MSKPIPDTETKVESNSQSPAQPPTGYSLLMCEQIMIETLSGKSTLLGVFSSLSAEEFPLTMPHLCLYGQISGTGKEETLTVRCQLTGKEELRAYESDFPVAKVPEGTTCEIKHVMRGARFEKPGLYEIKLLLGRKTLCKTVITLRELNPR